MTAETKTLNSSLSADQCFWQVTVASLLPATKTAAARKGKLLCKAGKENALSALQPSSLGIVKSGLAGSLRRTTRACAAH